MLILGCDPGGAGATGVAVADFHAGQPVVQTATCGSVDEAVDWFQAQTQAAPDAIGIDTYLSWATGPSGWRDMDWHLRHSYPQVQNSVFCSNSAAGSMAVQGMAIAMRLRALWPDIHLNETHPKVLYFSLTGQQYDFGQAMAHWLLNQFAPPINLGIANEHEWDALISAWATWQGLSAHWNTDLMNGVQNLLLPAGAVTYYWP